MPKSLKSLTLLALLSVWMAIPVGCAHLFQNTKDCAVEAGKDVQSDVLPTIRQILETPSVLVVEAKLADLAIKYGHDFVACMVAKVGSDAEHAVQAAPGVDRTAHDTVKLNARNWLATHK